MEIVEVGRSGPKTLGDLKTGSVFKFENRIYISTPAVRNCPSSMSVACVNLKNGLVHDINIKTEVIPLKAVMYVSRDDGDSDSDMTRLKKYDSDDDTDVEE